MSRLDSIDWWRKALMALVFAGLLGLALELVLVSHWYKLGQLIPFVAIAGTLGVSLIFMLRPAYLLLVGLRIVAVLLMLTGLLGAFEHLQANPRLLGEGRANLSARPADAKDVRVGIAGLPILPASPLEGPAPLSAPLAMSGLGVLLFLALHKLERSS